MIKLEGSSVVMNNSKSVLIQNKRRLKIINTAAIGPAVVAVSTDKHLPLN